MQAFDREQFDMMLRLANVKPRLKRELRFVPEEITQWQERDFLAIMNRSRSEGVLVVPFAKQVVAPFQLAPRRQNSSGRLEAIVCDICATWRRGTESAVISFIYTDKTRSFLCCADLLCSFHVRDKTDAAQLSRAQLQETISPAERIGRLKSRLENLLT